MNAQFLETAKAELREAVRYYNRQREGLGREFAAEVRKASQKGNSANRKTPERLAANFR